MSVSFRLSALVVAVVLTATTFVLPAYAAPSGRANLAAVLTAAR